ncbi:MAG: hypothetical protein DRI84_08650 [Bacteroidetes bacterium]|nr:MAG: hypothetical protein DRI84_08650 [Bacteroidota bacterium]
MNILIIRTAPFFRMVVTMTQNKYITASAVYESAEADGFCFFVSFVHHDKSWCYLNSYYNWLQQVIEIQKEIIRTAPFFRMVQSCKKQVA